MSRRRRSLKGVQLTTIPSAAVRAGPSLGAVCEPPRPPGDDDSGVDAETARLAEEVAMDIRTAPPPPPPVRQRVKRAVRYLASIAPDVTFQRRHVEQLCPRVGGKTIWDALQDLVRDGVIERVEPTGYRAARRAP